MRSKEFPSAMPLARTRSSSMSLRSQSSTSKLDVPTYHDEDDDDESSDGVDDIDSHQGADRGINTSAVDDPASGRRLSAASGPARTTKSRVKGESSQKRKEQNRVAQRAFRKRQKAYFVDLEKEVIEKSSKIQTITKSNQSLMEMMERLQRENIALKAAKAPNLSGISPLKPLTELRFPSVSSTSATRSSPTLMNADDEVLVSVDDLAPTKSRRKSKQSRTSTRRSSASATTSVKEPSSRSSPISPHSRSLDLGSPLSADVQVLSSDAGPYHPSEYTRRQSSSVSQRSASQASVLAAYASSNEGSFSSAPGPTTEKVTEIINNPTCWGAVDKRPLEQSQNFDQAKAMGGMQSTGWSQSFPVTAGSYSQQSQPQQQHSTGSISARRYSEALRRYHAEAPISPTAPGPRPFRADSMDPISFENANGRSGQYQPDQQQHAFLAAQNTMPFANNNGWMNTWQWDGHGFAGASRIPPGCDMNQNYPQATVPQQHHVPTSVPSTGYRQPLQGQQRDAPQAYDMATYQAKMFVNVAPGLKSEANGGMMPFEGVITPIDGLGPLDNPFRPNLERGPDGGPVWRDLGDLAHPDGQAFGMDVNNNGMLFDAISATPSSYVGQ